MIDGWLCSFELWVDDVRANQRDRVPLDDWQPRTKDWPAGNSIDDIKRAWVKCTHLRMALKTQPIRHACCLCDWLTYFTAELTLSLMASCPIVVELMTLYVVDQASIQESGKMLKSTKSGMFNTQSGLPVTIVEVDNREEIKLKARIINIADETLREFEQVTSELLVLQVQHDRQRVQQRKAQLKRAMQVLIIMIRIASLKHTLEQ